MPYSKASDAPDSVPEKHKAQWVEVWNSVHDSAVKAGKSQAEAEADAFVQANGVVKGKRQGMGFEVGVQTSSDPNVVAQPDLDAQPGATPVMREQNMSSNVEIRFAEMRAESEGDEMALVGYAAKFNSPSKQMTDKSGYQFVETIAPGAFTRALAEKQDVRCLFNHDNNKVLGRTASGTLTLKQDNVGLAFRCKLDPRQQAHRDLHAAVDRGDISECSFAFAPNGQQGDDWQDTRSADGSWMLKRTLKDVNLFDVSAVTHPAYNDTSVSAREATMTPEIRSILKTIVEKRALIEKREAGDSLEEYICEVSKALAEKFPQTGDANAWCGTYGGQYYVCETHVDYLIASDCSTGDYVRISYMEDGVDNYVFGTPVAVEKEWVESERGAKIVAEVRAMKASHMQAIADQHAATAAAHKDMSDAHTEAAAAHDDHAEAHAKAAEAAQKEADRMEKCAATMGDCSVRGCSCQNRMSDDDEVWEEEHEGENDDERKLRHAANCAETRDADGKTLTKKVDGKNLPASKFASVGDPKDTSTWKLPIHDKAHADNAAARLNQTEGIDKEAAKAKIEAAQKKFGEKKEDARSLNPDEQPMTVEEIEDWKNKFKLATL
jgi:uncharacterized protein